MAISNNLQKFTSIKSKYILEWTNQKIIDNKATMSETSTISSDMDSSINYVFTLQMMFENVYHFLRDYRIGKIG